MPRPQIHIEKTADGILWRLYHAIAEHEEQRFTPTRLADILELSINEIELALEILAENGACITDEEDTWLENPFTGNVEKETEKYVRITNIGTGTVDDWDNDKYDSVVHFVFERIDIDDYSEHLSQESITDGLEELIEPIPGSDRYVTRSDNQETWDEAHKSLDDVIAEFKSDHPRDNEVGAEKPAIQKVLEAGRDLMISGAIRVQLGTAYILESLRTIIVRWEMPIVTAAITEPSALITFAKTAYELFARLFGVT